MIRYHKSYIYTTDFTLHSRFVEFFLPENSYEVLTAHCVRVYVCVVLQLIIQLERSLLNSKHEL